MWHFEGQTEHTHRYDVIVTRAWMAGHGKLPSWKWQIRYMNEYLPVYKSGYGIDEDHARSDARDAFVSFLNDRVTNKGDRVIIDRIEYIEHLNSSVNGNPRFALHLKNEGKIITSSDCADTYDVENFANIDQPYTFTLTRAGRMRYVTPIKIHTNNRQDG